LAADLPALWEAPTTTAADRKAIIRQVIARVVVDVQGPSERVQVTLHWSGGGQTDAVCRRPVTKVEHLSTYPQLCDRLAVLVGEGLPAWRIAERLNAEGYRPPKYAARFGAQSVRELLRRQGLSPYRSRPKPITGLRPDEWGRSALAGVLEIPTGTLDNWIRHGWVTARHPPPALPALDYLGGRRRTGAAPAVPRAPHRR
jgi:hypothetical protein